MAEGSVQDCFSLISADYHCELDVYNSFLSKNSF